MQLPESGWKGICTMPLAEFNFNMSQIVAYFVTRSVSDGQIAGDIKSINKSAENLFICGHVQNIEFVNVDCWMYIKAKCLPEMRKDRVCMLKLVLKLKEHDIVSAECGCPAGLGPKGSCSCFDICSSRFQPSWKFA